MTGNERDDLAERVSARANHLWRAEGAPEGGPERYLGRARELLAIETDPDATTKPVTDPRAPAAEPILAVENQGEFPGLRDQGDDP